MSRPPVRLGGRLALPEGGLLVWSIAEGRRGRRWRGVALDSEGGMVSDVLLETDPRGRPARLEVATPAGLLTLHPGDGAGTATLHGNSVTVAGVRHHQLPWSGEHVLLVDRSPLTDAAACLPLVARLGVGEGTWLGSVVVDGALVPRSRQALAVRTESATFTIADPTSGDERTIRLTSEGTPDGGASMRWELELD
jgi:hypothetical protein